MVPDASLTLNADGVAADAGASVRLEALPAVAHPGLTSLMEYVFMRQNALLLKKIDSMTNRKTGAWQCNFPTF